jgi:protoporphyrinogen oxidase
VNDQTKTLEDWALENGLQKDFLPLLNASISNDRCTDPHHAGLVETQIAENNWTYGDYDGIPPNFEPLIDHLTENLKDKIRLKSPVHKIVSEEVYQNTYPVTVFFNETSIKCQAVIVSVPLPIL